MKIYRQYVRVVPQFVTTKKDEIIEWVPDLKSNKLWMIELNNKFILNFFFGWHVKKNTNIKASFGTWKDGLKIIGEGDRV